MMVLIEGVLMCILCHLYLTTTLNILHVYRKTLLSVLCNKRVYSRNQ